ncbi:MAG: PTS lactose/cellobiose transporter subunit IIA [Liquorilactobacillus nagelii]|jgi:PTS system cellobiose-specific IIA component|uniref:PTS lactose/cellobiose transporter subunit IIA n=1 Tax=Liquorilactobacillus nagelii TaxID=82688 RepID=UPI0039E79777
MTDIEQIIFEIISNSGEARSILMGIIKNSEEGNFGECETKLKIAKQRLKDAHKAHFEIITSESKNNQLSFNLLLVHAEDQMMAAEIVFDLTETIIRANKRIFHLEKKCGNQ